MANGDPAYQLARLVRARQTISRQVNRRRVGVPLQVMPTGGRSSTPSSARCPWMTTARKNWRGEEKAAALEVLATSRVSVLIGAAGTGKTTLLRALSTLPAVGERWATPAGAHRQGTRPDAGRDRRASQPARRRRSPSFSSASTATTRETGRYHRSDHDRISAARTVIVDESSMLTEEALDALLDGIEGFDRLILVGDPRQLPPIGVGTAIRRHRPSTFESSAGRSASLGWVRPTRSSPFLGARSAMRAIATEPTFCLAEWFAGGEPSPGADEVWERLGGRQGPRDDIRAALEDFG